MPSRTTFRPAVELAWQRQIRDRYADESPPPVDLSLKKARIKAVSRDEAKQIILKYEWLGTMQNTTIHYGLFFGPFLAGVTCVGINGAGTAGVYRGREWGLELRELSTLARGANVSWSPPGANSKLVAWTVRLLRDDDPKTRLIIAYADADAGEIGTIYQACGWTYVGDTNTKGSSPTELVSPKGRMINIATVGAKAKKAGVRYREMHRRYLDAGWTEQQSSRKRKYVQVVQKNDRELEDLVAERRLPYPKRAGSIDGDAPTAQVGRGRFDSDPGAPNPMEE